MIGKFAYLLAFLVTIVAVAEPASEPLRGIYSANSRSHHLIVGYPVSGDGLVLKQQIYRNPVLNQIITVQQTFNASPYENITRVKALDQTPDGRGAFVSLLKGGPGSSNVTLHFQSQKGQGIHYFVELYAKL